MNCELVYLLPSSSYFTMKPFSNIKLLEYRTLKIRSFHFKMFLSQASLVGFYYYNFFILNRTHNRFLGIKTFHFMNTHKSDYKHNVQENHSSFKGWRNAALFAIISVEILHDMI